jgi:hypothetical protein
LAAATLIHLICPVTVAHASIAVIRLLSLALLLSLTSSLPSLLSLALLSFRPLTSLLSLALLLTLAGTLASLLSSSPALVLLFIIIWH